MLDRVGLGCNGTGTAAASAGSAEARGMLDVDGSTLLDGFAVFALKRLAACERLLLGFTAVSSVLLLYCVSMPYSGALGLAGGLGVNSRVAITGFGGGVFTPAGFDVFADDFGGTALTMAAVFGGEVFPRAFGGGEFTCVGEMFTMAFGGDMFTVAGSGGAVFTNAFGGSEFTMAGCGGEMFTMAFGGDGFTMAGCEVFADAFGGDGFTMAGCEVFANAFGGDMFTMAGVGGAAVNAFGGGEFTMDPCGGVITNAFGGGDFTMAGDGNEAKAFGGDASEVGHRASVGSPLMCVKGCLGGGENAFFGTTCCGVGGGLPSGPTRGLLTAHATMVFAFLSGAAGLGTGAGESAGDVESDKVAIDTDLNQSIRVFACLHRRTHVHI